MPRRSSSLVPIKRTPDWLRVQAIGNPHAEEGAGVVIRLQVANLLALQVEDDGVCRQAIPPVKREKGSQRPTWRASG